MLRLILVAVAIVGGFGAPADINERANGNILNPKIIVVGDDSEDLGPIPYQLAIEWNNITLCGAAVVGTYHAVTAAHCIVGHTTHPADVVLRVGSDNRGTGGHLHRAVRIEPHDKYTAENDDYDVAIIQVNKPFHRNRVLELGSRRLPKVATVSGWGASDPSTNLSSQLQWTQVQIVDKAACLDAYRGTAELAKITDRMLCAGGKGKGVCTGDDGSPLVSSMVLVGIVHAYKECGGKYPDVYTDVSKVQDWIASEMKASTIGNDAKGEVTKDLAKMAPSPTESVPAEPPSVETTDKVEATGAEQPAAGNAAARQPAPENSTAVEASKAPSSNQRRPFSGIPFPIDNIGSFQMLPFPMFQFPIKDQQWTWVSASAGPPPADSSKTTPPSTDPSNENPSAADPSQQGGSSSVSSPKGPTSLNDLFPNLPFKFPFMSWSFHQPNKDNGRQVQPPENRPGFDEDSDEIPSQEPGYQIWQFPSGAFRGPFHPPQIYQSGYYYPMQPYPMRPSPIGDWIR